jgi:pantoate--beta-alanine ligase
MQTVTSRNALRATIAHWRAGGQRVAFVPTMGNLHAGHLRLVEHARQVADRVVVSIFVNPLQFGPEEDFASYPRTPEADSLHLAEMDVDLLFAPPVEEMYPDGAASATRVEVAGLSEILCGAVRPGHFAGVATIVTKLLNLVQPEVAIFGEKDYQQLAVIRRMAADLFLPVHIAGVPTVREPDGLAMSSRNHYLAPAERESAPALYAALRHAAGRIAAGAPDWEGIEAEGLEWLRRAGFRPDYFVVRSAPDLDPPTPQCAELVVLAAGTLGRTRLIDNVTVALNERV